MVTATSPVASTQKIAAVLADVYRGAEWYITDPQAPHARREAPAVQFEPTVVPAYEDFRDRVTHPTANKGVVAAA